MIEFVAVLPVMFLIVIGSVDVCNNIFTKQGLTEVSYQGAVDGTDADTTEADLRASLNSYLIARGMGNANVITRGLDGSAFDEVGRGEAFEVIIEMAAADRDDAPVIIQYVDLRARSVGVRQ